MHETETFPSLTGLRFVLALWIAVYHLIMMYGSQTLAGSWFVSLGNVRVDVFFALSGFVLAHVYALPSEGKLDFGAFFKARLARLYPLHLLGIAILLAAVLGAFLLSRGQEASQHTPLGLLANLLMLQAWAIPGGGHWNFPTWTLSAEMFAYLMFPAMIVVAERFRRAPMLFWGLVLALTAVASGFYPRLGRGPLADASVDFGAIRGLFGFAGGVATRYLFERVSLTRERALALAGAGAVLAGVAAVRGWDLSVVMVGAGALVLGIAGLDRAGARTWLATPTMRALGAMSFALFCLHVPMFVILSRVLGFAGWNGQLDYVSGCFMLAVVLSASWPTHKLIEEPARRAMRNFRYASLLDFRHRFVQKPVNVAN